MENVEEMMAYWKEDTNVFDAPEKEKDKHERKEKYEHERKENEEMFRELKENARIAAIRMEAAEQSEDSINERLDAAEILIQSLAASTKDAVEDLTQLHIASHEAAQETAAAQRLYNLVYPKWEEEEYKRQLAENGKRIKPNWDGYGNEWEYIDSANTGDGRKYKSKRKKKTKSKRKKKTKSKRKKK
jgi:hypothetical protein